MTMENQVGGFSTEIVVTPTISTSAYTANDQVGGIQTLAVLNQQSQPIDAACQDKTVAYLMGLKIIDKAKQDQPFTIYFFNTLPTVASVDNAALSIVDAQSAKCVGFVKVTAANYAGPAEWSIADVAFADVMRSFKSDTDNGPLYAVVQTTGTPTYATTADLTFKYYFSQDLGNGKDV
jgi:hypothetical protein